MFVSVHPTTLRAATPRAAPRNGHTKSCHESMGQPSLTLSSKDEPRGPNQNRSTSASGNGNSEKYHRSSLDQPPRDPGLPERRFRCTLDHPDLATQRVPISTTGRVRLVQIVSSRTAKQFDHSSHGVPTQESSIFSLGLTPKCDPATPRGS